MRLFHILFLGLIAATLNISLHAQTQISGTVCDIHKKGIGNVVIKALSGKQTLAYTMSHANGKYTLKIPGTSSAKKIELSFSKMGYAKQVFLWDSTQPTNITLKEEAIKLHEVEVKPPAIFTLGDTLRYSFHAFVRPEDQTLEEGLKRIPGLSVNEKGTISFMGRNISQFYIEGLNLLGGQYALATKNVPVNKVTGVEVLRHHQTYKINKGQLSNDVALNIKLSNKAKIKPFGTYEAKAGIRDDKFLYGLGGTAMLFRKNFQMLGTIKASNDSRLGTSDLNSLYRRSPLSDLTQQVLPSLSISRPPLPDFRYKTIQNELVSINAIKKMGKNVTLNINADYAHSDQDYGYHSERHYPNGNSTLIVHEQTASQQASHQPKMRLNYTLNSEQKLITNTTDIQAKIQDNKVPAWTENTLYGQGQQEKAFGIKNSFSIQKRRNEWRWDFNSELQYEQTPQNELNISNETFASDWIQQADSKTFHTKEEFSTRYEISHNLSVSLPVEFSLDYNELSTLLTRPDTISRNLLDGWEYQLSFSPAIHYQNSKRKIQADLSAPFIYLRKNYDYAYQQHVQNKFYCNPFLNFQYIVNSQSELNLQAYINHHYGNILDLLIAPVQTDYRTQRTRAGILGQSKSYSAALQYDWQSPINFWFLNIRGSYNRQWNNVLNNQTLEQADISQTMQALNNTSDGIGISAKATKTILSWNTNLSLGSSYNWQKGQMGQEALPITFRNQTYAINGEASFTPVNLIELDYTGEFRQNFSRHASTSNNTYSQSHQGKAVLRPHKQISISLLSNYICSEMVSGTLKKFTLIDACIEYRIKKLKLKLEINNLLNKKEYSYTVYDMLNAYSYSYKLHGREFLLSVSLF